MSQIWNTKGVGSVPEFIKPNFCVSEITTYAHIYKIITYTQISRKNHNKNTLGSAKKNDFIKGWRGWGVTIVWISICPKAKPLFMSKLTKTCLLHTGCTFTRQIFSYKLAQIEFGQIHSINYIFFRYFIREMLRQKYKKTKRHKESWFCLQTYFMQTAEASLTLREKQKMPIQYSLFTNIKVITYGLIWTNIFAQTSLLDVRWY